MVCNAVKVPPLPPIPSLEAHRELQPGQLDVVFADIDRPPSEIDRYAAVLSARETDRAQRFRAASDRHRYVVRHAILRMLLAGYLNCAPNKVEICCDPNGKPHLAQHSNHTELRFSDSHSNAYAAFAFCRYKNTGVDLEQVREIPEMLEIVARHFTRREHHAVLSCPPDRRVIMFYRLWTRKEAVLKAQGEGLLRPLDCVDVAAAEESPGPWTVSLGGCPAADYTVADILAPAGFAAAVAVAGRISSIAVHHLWTEGP